MTYHAPADSPGGLGGTGNARAEPLPGLDAWAVLQTISDAVVVLDADLAICFWNMAASDLLGWQASEVHGQPIANFVFGTEEEGFTWDEVGLALHAHGAWSGRGRVCNRSGATLIVEGTLQRIVGPDGCLQAYIAVGRAAQRQVPVAVREQALAVALRTSEDQLRLIVEGAREYALFLLAADGRVASWNIGAERIKGYRATEIVGSHISRFYSQEDQARGWPEQLLRAAQSKGYVEDEGWRVRKDGTRFWASVLITALYDDAGHLQGFSKLTRDSTAHKRVEDARATQQRRVILLAEISQRLLLSDSPGALLQDIFADLARELDVVYFFNYMVPAHGDCLVLESSGGLSDAERAAFGIVHFGESLCGVLAEQRAPLVLGDLQRSTWANTATLKRMGMTAYAGHPLIANDHLIGTLAFASSTRPHFDEDDLRLMRAVSAQVAAAVERSRLVTELRASQSSLQDLAQRLAVLADASRAFTAVGPDYQATLDQVTQIMAEELGDICFIRLLSDSGAWSQIAAIYGGGLDRNSASGAAWAAQLPLAEQAYAKQTVDDGQPMLLTSVDAAQLRATARPEFWPLLDRFPPHSAILVPLRAHGTIMGLLTIWRYRPEQPSYTDDDLRLAGDLADRAALAISSARLFREASQAVEQKQQALALLDTLFTTAPVGLAFVNTELRYERVNAALAEINGLSPEAHLGQPVRAIVPGLVPAVEGQYRKVLENGEALIELEVSGMTSASPTSLRHWLASYYPVRIDGGPILGVGLVVVEITDRKQGEIALRATATQLQAISRRLVEVQEAERRHIARELHDQIGQMLTGLNLLLEVGPAFSTEALKSRMREAQELIGELIDRVRTLSLDLRPSMLDDLGLLPTLRWHMRRYTEQTQVRVHFRHSGLELPIESAVAVAAYRIVQEALTNVARYAEVGEVDVQVWVANATLHAQVEDSGRGFDQAAVLVGQHSNGLAGMSERATLLGGRVCINSAPGEGTRVLAELPLDQPTITQG